MLETGVPFIRRKIDADGPAGGKERLRYLSNPNPTTFEWAKIGVKVEHVEGRVMISTSALPWSYAAAARTAISSVILKSGDDMFQRVRVPDAKGNNPLSLANIKANALYNEIELSFEDRSKTAGFLINILQPSTLAQKRKSLT